MSGDNATRFIAANEGDSVMWVEVDSPDTVPASWDEEERCWRSGTDCDCCDQEIPIGNTSPADDGQWQWQVYTVAYETELFPADSLEVGDCCVDGWEALAKLVGPRK